MQTYNDFFKLYTDLISLHFSECDSVHKDVWCDLTLTHSMFVAKIAIGLSSTLEAKGIFVLEEEIMRASILHDIGVYKCYDGEFNPEKSLPKYISHGQIGAKIIENQLSDKVASRVAMTHTSFGGISIDEIKSENLPLDPIDMTQISLLEELISWADKFHTKWPKFRSIDEVEEEAQKFGEYKHSLFTFYKSKFGVPNTQTLQEESREWHKKIDTVIESLTTNES